LKLEFIGRPGGFKVDLSKKYSWRYNYSHFIWCRLSL